jgi:hypothetical protein
MHAVVHVSLRRRVAREDRCGVVGVDVAERYNVFTRAIFEIGRALAFGADADAGEVEFVARGLGAEEVAAEKLKTEGHGGGGGEKTAAGGQGAFHR